MPIIFMKGWFAPCLAVMLSISEAPTELMIAWYIYDSIALFFGHLCIIHQDHTTGVQLLETKSSKNINRGWELSLTHDKS